MHRFTLPAIVLTILSLAAAGPLPAQQRANHGQPPLVSFVAPAEKEAPAAVLQRSGRNLAMGENVIGNASGDSFGTFRLISPAIVSSIGTLILDSSGAEFIDEIYRKLLVITPAGALYQIGTGNGTATYVATADAFGSEDFSALAENPTTGTLYAASTDCSSSSLYTLNPATGVATRIGPITNAPCLVAMAFNAVGQLYGVDISVDMLVGINPASAAGTLIGSLGFDANYSQGMDFDPNTNTCYLFAFNDAAASPAGCELRTCNVGTGSSSRVGQLGGTTVDSMACFGGAAIAGLFSDDFETGNTSRWSNTVP